MKNPLKNLVPGITFLAMLSLLCLPAFGQGSSVDMFGVPRFVLLDQGTISTNTSGTASITNGAVDIHGFDGLASIFITMNQCSTNGLPSYGTWGVQLQQSTTGTNNWTSLTNTAAGVQWTNGVVNFGQGSTNNVVLLLAGTPTTVTPGSAGYASPYGGVFLSPSAFTGTGVLTNAPITGVANQPIALAGFSINDSQRYLRTIYTFTTTQTVNFASSALLIARRMNSLY